MQFVELAERKIGPGQPCFVIAEAGVNHNGDLAMAQELVRQAQKAGADCIKFQTFKAERVAAGMAPKAAYQLRSTNPAESQFAMLRKLELSESDHRALLEQCHREGIVFLSTPYSIEDAELLHALDVPGFKIASGQVIELPFLAALARFNRPVILSTGMATLAEVTEAVTTLRQHGNTQLIVLQCTTNYPSRLADTNLRAMATIAHATGAFTGYSDHTEGITACLAAIALGACVIEKHFTLDRNLPGPDHRCSSEPTELSALVRGIREVEITLGDGVKRPTEAELANVTGVRRSIAASRDLPAGHVLGERDLQFLRPATGLPPCDWDRVVGRRTRIALSPGTLLSWEHLA
jgi:N-acetylneuraminate synthase/N,N'-diacetyllegionaminate synthase